MLFFSKITCEDLHYRAETVVRPLEDLLVLHNVVASHHIGFTFRLHTLITMMQYYILEYYQHCGTSEAVDSVQIQICVPQINLKKYVALTGVKSSTIHIASSGNIFPPSHLHFHFSVLNHIA